MLPRMEMFKEAAFCRRLVALNHSFVPAGGSAPTKPVVANIWHEAIAGRTASEMATSMLAFLTNDALPEADKIPIWLDNCSYQNKNYLLFQAMQAAVENGDVPFNEVEFRYFVVGHSFMAAESYHSRIEAEFKKMEVVLNFRDFSAACRSADKNCVTNSLRYHQFLAFPDDRSSSLIGKSSTTISQICTAKFSQGFPRIMIKDMWRGLWKASQFLKRNADLVPLSALDQLREAPRGIGKRKKKDIQKTLLPLFLNFRYGERKQNFWNEIPTTTHSPDLAVTDDEDPSFVE